MYIDKNKLLKSLDEKDIEIILQNLSGYKYKKDSHHNFLTCTALCHPNGDSPFKLIIYPNTNSDKEPLVVCMTCGCKMDLITFCLKAKRNTGTGSTWYKCLQWIAMITGRTEEVAIENNIQIRKREDFSWIKRIKNIKQKEQEEPEEQEINENILELFTYIPHEAWLMDGCSEESMIRFDISYYPPMDQIVIPHRDANGKLVGIRVRNLDKNVIESVGKYLPLHEIEGIRFNHQLSKYLYGLWVTKDYIQKCGKILLAEGEKSCLQAYSMFSVEEDKSYVVATCGSNISQRQIEIIKSLGVSKVIYAPDKEYKKSDSFEAEAWFNKQILKLEPFLLYCQVYLIADTKDRIGYKDSPFDKGRSTFLELYEEKIEITMDDINRVKQEMKKGDSVK